MISKKRGMIELNFHWIFILIAGAIIFIFFINIVNKQREFSEVRASGTIITNLEAILIGAQISTDTVNIIDMPKADIGFECNRFFIGSIPRQTKGNVIFSPDLLKGKELITWALDWNMPYRVTNFLYLTDPQLRYIIVDKPNIPGEKVFDELPKEINKEIINDTASIINKNNYKVKFIFFDDFDGIFDDFNNKYNKLTKSLKKMSDEDVTGIIIKAEFTTDNIIPNTGYMEFIQKEGSEWKTIGTTTSYIKKEALYGAIFAADVKMYNCVMRKAFKKLNLVTKIYLDRSDKLEEDYFNNGNSCYESHSNAKTELDKMEATSAVESENFPLFPGLEGLKRMNDIAIYSTNIKNENQNAQLYSCALIY